MGGQTAAASGASSVGTDPVGDANVTGTGSGHINYFNSIMCDAFTSSAEGSEVLRTASMGGYIGLRHIIGDRRLCYTTLVTR